MTQRDAALARLSAAVMAVRVARSKWDKESAGIEMMSAEEAWKKISKVPNEKM